MLVESKSWFFLSVIVVLISITGCSSSTKVTYIGSAGYMLDSGSKKILIDVPFSDFVRKFEVPVATLATQDRIISGDAPFNDIDLILIYEIV